MCLILMGLTNIKLIRSDNQKVSIVREDIKKRRKGYFGAFLSRDSF